MEKIQNINASRISWCCDDARITPETLAREAGIAEKTLQRLLSGEDSITWNQLKRIADYFKRGALFFLEPEPINGSRIYSAAFRTIANQKHNLSSDIKALIQRCEKQRDVYIALAEDLDDKPNQFSAPIIPQNPAAAAAIARRWLNLPEKNDFETLRTAVEEKGILVFLTNGFQGDWQIPKRNPVLGFSLYDDKFPLIVVKKAIYKSRQAFTLAHELAHVLIHKESIVDEESDLQSYIGQERVANEFAAHLLVPDEFIEKVDIAAKPYRAEQFDDWLKTYRHAWGASTEVLLLRLVRAGTIPQEDYSNYKHWIDSRIQSDAEGVRLYRHREPRNIFGDRFVRSVLDALEQERITLNKASNFLDGIKVSDIRKLEEFCASR